MHCRYRWCTHLQVKTVPLFLCSIQASMHSTAPDEQRCKDVWVVHCMQSFHCKASDDNRYTHAWRCYGRRVALVSHIHSVVAGAPWTSIKATALHFKPTLLSSSSQFCCPTAADTALLLFTANIAF